MKRVLAANGSESPAPGPERDSRLFGILLNLVVPNCFLLRVTRAYGEGGALARKMSDYPTIRPIGRVTFGTGCLPGRGPGRDARGALRVR